MNLPAFSFAVVRQYWKYIAIGLLVIALFIQTTRLSLEQARRKADHAAVIAASAKVTEAAAKAEIAAMAVDAVRRGEAKAMQEKLRSIVDEKADTSVAGPGVIGVLDELRKADRR